MNKNRCGRTGACRGNLSILPFGDREIPSFFLVTALRIRYNEKNRQIDSPPKGEDRRIYRGG